MARKVLAVDNDAGFLEELDSHLCRAGFVLLPSHSAPAALAVARVCREEIDLAVVDLDLEGDSGFALIMELHQIAPKLKILAASRTLQPHVMEGARYVGAADFLRKPFDQSWLEAIGQAMSQQTAS